MSFPGENRQPSITVKLAPGARGFQNPRGNVACRLSSRRLLPPEQCTLSPTVGLSGLQRMPPHSLTTQMSQLTQSATNMPNYYCEYPNPSGADYEYPKPYRYTYPI